MRTFGKKDEFQIDYQNYVEIYPEHPDVQAHPEKYEEGGSVYFWVKGKNLFAFKGFGPEATYTANLNILIEFFCNNLYFHLSEDPFPATTEATNASDMMSEMSLVEGPDNDITKYLDVDWDKVDSELYGKIVIWGDRHGTITNRDGSFLPDLFIRKVEHQIEISWHNESPYRTVEGEVYLEYEKGVEYIDLKLFKDTVVAFCLDFINRFQDKHPEQMERYRQNLQKAIDLPV